MQLSAKNKTNEINVEFPGHQIMQPNQILPNKSLSFNQWSYMTEIYKGLHATWMIINLWHFEYVQILAKANLLQTINLQSM